MSCLLDPLGCILGLIPEWAWWALSAFAVLFVIGVLWRLKDFLALIHRIAGWPGVAAIVGAVAVLFALFWPKRSTRDDFRGEVEGNDGKSRDDFLMFPRKPHRTAKRTPGKRRFNPDTGQWEEIP